MDDWIKYYSCHKIDSFLEDVEQEKQFQPPSGWNMNSPPYSMDWRYRNAVTRVRNQVQMASE